MKINELVEKINEHDGMRAKEVDKGIVISTPMGTFSIPKDATNFIEIDTWVTNNSLYWSKSNREYLSALIEKFLHTPVKERFSEKEYRLRWIDSKLSGLHSFPCYLFIISNCWDMADNDLCGKAIFTESELNKLKKDNPRLAPAIEAMKEPLREDNDEN